MTYTEIYIDDELIDLGSSPITCPITYQLIDIKNLSKRSGSRTKSVTVPRTAKNDKLFGIASDINARNNFDKYQPHRVRIEEATEVIFDGLCKLTRVTPSTIEFFCYGELSAFKGISGTLTLNDLRLNDLDHLYTSGVVFDTWDGVYPTYVADDFIYPLIDYGAFFDRTIAVENPVLHTELYPAVYLRRIINQICLDNGYTLVTNFFDDPTWSRLIIPFTNEKFIHSENYLVETDGFEGYTSSNTPFGIRLSIGEQNLPILTEVFDPNDQWHQFNREYTAQSNQRVRIDFKGFVQFVGTFNPSEVQFQFKIQKYDSVGMAWEDLQVNSFAAVTSARQYMDYSVNTNLVTGDKIRFLINKLTTTTILQTIAIYAENAKITPQPVTGIEIQSGELVQLAPNLPSIKQIDLFAWCFQMFNWVIDVDQRQGTITIDTFQNYYSNPSVIDMSQALTLSIDPIIEYDDPRFSRKYDFQYTLDDEDYYLNIQNGIDQSESGLNFGDGKLYLTEQGDATLIGKVGFSPTVIGLSFADSMEIPMMITTTATDAANPEVSTNHAPRIMIYGGLVDVDTLTDGAFTEIETDDGSKTSVAFAYFQKRVYDDATIDVFVQQLSFQNNSANTFYGDPVVWSSNGLIDAGYRSTILDLSNSASITAWFNIKPSDLGSLDYSVRWYVDYFESQFRLNRIVDYQPGRLAPTKVELVKVGAYINPRALDTLE